MSRQSILQLPQSLINRIAAGEVIERPASVVKELIDNSIDAGATDITIEIGDGGRELIRVIDNGSGIPPDELPLAFAPHATSKLRSDEDLTRIMTMGFRGEALASIGSVAFARIVSRQDGSDAAYEVTNNGGDLSDPQACAGNVGTTVEIRNLFFNTPARRKFLKGTATEFGHISDAVLRLALSQPAVGFCLKHNGRVVRELPPTSHDERLLAAWPKDFHEQRLPVKSRDAEVMLTGLIGLPELASHTPKYQHFYVNGRPIRDKFVQHALREAYRGLTEPGRHPAAILLVRMPPDDVDVNVHPTKSEVRFRDSGRIHGAVMSTVREVLLGNDLTPRAVAHAHTPMPQIQRESMQNQLAAFFKAGPASSSGSAPAGDDSFLDGRTSSHYATTPTGDRQPFELHRQPMQTAMTFDPARRSSRDERSSYAPVGYSARLPALPADPTATREDSPDSASSSTLSSTEGIEGDNGDESSRGDRSGEHASALDRPATPRPHGSLQLHNSYLVVQSAEGMLIIDQHALHERIIYEELLARTTAGPLESQRMLIPQVIAATARQIDLLTQIRPLLQKLGIEADAFSPESIAVHAFPSFLDRLDPGDFLSAVLEKGEQESLDLTEEELLHDVLDMMSCRAAIKAGDPLTAAEIDALLQRRELVERSSNCPHGRPTTLRLSLADLEKQFKRTGF